MSYKLKIDKDAPLSSIIEVLNQMDLTIAKEDIYIQMKDIPGLAITPMLCQANTTKLSKPRYLSIVLSTKGGTYDANAKEG